MGEGHRQRLTFHAQTSHLRTWLHLRIRRLTAPASIMRQRIRCDSSVKAMGQALSYLVSSSILKTIGAFCSCLSRPAFSL